MFNLQPFRLKAHKARASSGFALWDTLLLVALIGALLLVAFVSQQSRVHLHKAQEQAATLLWADQQVAGFSSSHLRLPCPDTNNDGLEDCAGNAVDGLLPVRTLGLKADAATRGPVRILYNMLRPPGMDPAVLASYFEPEMWDGTKYNYGTANGLDFCRKLADVVAANAAAVAYTVGLKRLDGEPDLERSHSASDLSNNLSCITTMSSVNGIALAVDVVNEVLSQQQSTHDAAIITIAFNALHIVLTAIDISLNAILMAASIAALGVASGLLAGAVASCIVLVGCAFIPVYTAAVTFAAVSIGLFGVAIGLGVAAIVTLVVSTALAIEVAIKTGNDPGDQTLDVDLDQVKQAALDSATKATEEENKVTAFYNDMINKQNAKNLAYDRVYSSAQSADPDDDYDADVNAAMAAAIAYNNASQALDTAQGELDQANDDVSSMIDAYAKQQDDCANAEPKRKPYICDAVPKVLDRLHAAQQKAAVKLTARNNAANQFNVASAAYTTAMNKISDDFGDATICWLFPGLGVYCGIEDYRQKYLLWQKSIAAYNVQRETAIKARASANQAWAAYVQMRDQGLPGATGSGGAITVWAGAEAILRQADANGVVE